MKTLLYNGTLVVNGDICYEGGSILIEGDKIVEVLSKDDAKLQVYQCDKDIDFIDVHHQYIMPGLIDVHIHGAVGYDFDVADQSAVDAIAHHLVEDGCTGFLASLTALSQETTVRVLKRYAKLQDQKEGAHFLGVHLEGPYLSQEYKAVMVAENLRNPIKQELDAMMLASNGRIKTMTVAPELPQMMEFIRYATTSRIKVFLGHSAASSKIAREGLQAGAVGFTHLYNAMSQHLHREPGMVTAAFINREAYVELIVDGYHVDPEVVLMTYRNKGAKTIVLITDAMLGKGMADGEFSFSGKQCLKVGNSVVVKETGRRAGSVIGLAHAIRKMVEITGCTANEIVQMACVNPAIIAQVTNTKGSLEVGKDADICIMDEHYVNQMTFVGGNLVFKKNRQK